MTFNVSSITHNTLFYRFTVEFSNKWYVNQDEQICQQDCPEEASSSTCGGQVQSWNTLYDTPDSCCAHKLYWIPQAACAQKSLLQSVTGSDKWYVDWVLQKVSPRHAINCRCSVASNSNLQSHCCVLINDAVHQRLRKWRRLRWTCIVT